MPNLTKRGFKKPLETETYDININNFNIDKTEEELDKLLSNDGEGKDVKVTFTEAGADAELISQSKLSVLFGLIKKKFNVVGQELEDKADLVGGKVPNNQLPVMDYAQTLHTHTKTNITDFPVSMLANGGNADTVNSLTVLTAVPINAKFTDTVYAHPATHPPSIIAQDGNNRFMTDAERTKLSGIATGANNYTHPNSGVAAGTFMRTTVNAQGHVTAGNNSVISVAEGGTGSTTSVAARTALGAAPAVQSGTAAPTAFVGEGVLFGVHS